MPPPIPHGFDDRSPKVSAAAYKAALRQIVRETLDSGSAIVLSSFITLAHEGLEVQYAANPGVFNDLYRNWYPLTPGELERIYRYVNDQARVVAEEFSVPFADVATGFPKDLRYFPFDLIHLSPEGNRLLARRFASALTTEVLPGSIRLGVAGQRGLGRPRRGNQR